MPSEAALIEAAHAARERAVAPISRYRVGAALEGSGGVVYTGCNIENVALGETICAERVALYKAIEAGERDFARVVVSTGSRPPASPCGSCRQVLFTWGVRRVISVNDRGERRDWPIEALLPDGFSPDPGELGEGG